MMSLPVVTFRSSVGIGHPFVSIIAIREQPDARIRLFVDA